MLKFNGDFHYENIGAYRVSAALSSSAGNSRVLIGERDNAKYALKMISKSSSRKTKYPRHNKDGEVYHVTGLTKITEEIEILRSIQHDNVLTFQEAIDEDDDDNVIIVTDWVEYGPILITNNININTSTAQTTKSSNHYLQLQRTHSSHFRCNPAVAYLFYSCPNEVDINNHDIMPIIRHLPPAATNTTLTSVGDYLPEECILLYLHDIIQGLYYLHSHNIAHRDIKPANLLLSSRNTVIIADFGSAMCFTRSAGNPTGLVSDTVGTPAFWAPECVQPERFASTCDIGLSLDSTDADGGGDGDDDGGSDNCDNNNNVDCDSGMRSSDDMNSGGTSETANDHEHVVYQYSAYALDIWALGVTLYALCYCALPFYCGDDEDEEENVVSLFDMICNNDPFVANNSCNNNSNNNSRHLNQQQKQRLSSGCQEISPSLLSILEGCLEKEPSCRWTVDNLYEHDWLSGCVGLIERRGNVRPVGSDVFPAVSHGGGSGGGLKRQAVISYEFESNDNQYNSNNLAAVEVRPSYSTNSDVKDSAYSCFRTTATSATATTTTTLPHQSSHTNNTHLHHDHDHDHDHSNPSKLPSLAVIFLDVDGVLTMSRCLTNDYDDCDESLVFPEDVTMPGSHEVVYEGPPLERRQLENLKWLVDQSGAHIVLSSTWRQQPELRAYLLAALEFVRIPASTVIGDTPCLPQFGRGGEIDNWLCEHTQYRRYVVMDDSHEDSITQFIGAEYFVKTQLQGVNYDSEGLTRKLAEKALQILIRQRG